MAGVTDEAETANSQSMNTSGVMSDVETQNAKPISQDLEEQSEVTYANPMVQKIANYFQLQERKTTFRTELLAGLVTFMTMAYILAVNASIISDSGGTCINYLEDGDDAAFFDCLEIFKRDLITATAACACISSLFMGLTANMPMGVKSMCILFPILNACPCVLNTWLW